MDKLIQIGGFILLLLVIGATTYWVVGFVQARVATTSVPSPTPFEQAESLNSGPAPAPPSPSVPPMGVAAPAVPESTPLFIVPSPPPEAAKECDPASGGAYASSQSTVTINGETITSSKTDCGETASVDNNISIHEGGVSVDTRSESRANTE